MGRYSVEHRWSPFSRFVELMIGFCRIKGLIGYNLSGDRKSLDRSQLLNIGRGRLPLTVAMGKDHRSILCANVGTLSIDLRWIMAGKEHLEQLTIGDNSWIVRDLNRFSMARFSSAYLCVGRIRNIAARITNRGREDTGHFGENSLHVPEASTSEGCDLHWISSSFSLSRQSNEINELHNLHAARYIYESGRKNRWSSWQRKTIALVIAFCYVKRRHPSSWTSQAKHDDKRIRICDSSVETTLSNQLDSRLHHRTFSIKNDTPRLPESETRTGVCTFGSRGRQKRRLVHQLTALCEKRWRTQLPLVW